MRIRQVKPEFFSDELVSSWPDAVRLLYIGLWLEADDAGWLEWRVPRIAANLYPYRPRVARERQLTRWSETLTAAHRLVIHDCGHAFLPHLTEHQRFGGKQVHTVHSAHTRECTRTIAEVRHGKERVEVGNGKERNGKARARDEENGMPDEYLKDHLAIDAQARARAVKEAEQLLANPKTTEAVRKAAQKVIDKYGTATTA